jgi:hypothetical protein
LKEKEIRERRKSKLTEQQLDQPIAKTSGFADQKELQTDPDSGSDSPSSTDTDTEIDSKEQFVPISKKDICGFIISSKHFKF